jgi:hypothetical protein
MIGMVENPVHSHVYLEESGQNVEAGFANYTSACTMVLYKDQFILLKPEHECLLGLMIERPAMQDAY